MTNITDILNDYCIINDDEESLCNGDEKSESSRTPDRGIASTFPGYDVPENIVLCIDVSSEMDRQVFKTKSGDRHSAMALMKKALGIFLSTKFKMRSDHSIAVCSLFDEANVNEARYHEERRQRKLLTQIDELEAKFALDTCNLTSLFTWLRGQLPPLCSPSASVLPPEYTLRLVLVYGRSHTMPVIDNMEYFQELMDHPFFFLDVFYIHEQPDQSNMCEAIFDFFCSLDKKTSSYVMEVARSPTKLFDQMAQLLAHPLQRPPQSSANYRFDG